MSGNGGEEAPRPRPLSGGLWTLFSWLRRDERASSSDSLSSAGSDRTALSFAFLPPVSYSNGVSPLVVPPPGPPTDSYRKRVQERNLRRQHDRNITLHRKYGLYRTDCPNGYDALSLPPVRRSNADLNCKWDRERRATSECFQSRIVHVPGKRRAPLPPTRAASVDPSITLTRRPRKRPAPQPPVKRLEKIEEDNLQFNNNKVMEMNTKTSDIQYLTKNNDISMGCKPEKYSKKDSNNSKENKVRSEKSFLKQIFENKKRNSSVETTSIKVLPNISELDKQAAEIIKTNKQNAVDKNTNITSLNLTNRKSQGSNETCKGEYWFCIICLRKYDSSVADCLYCLNKQNSQPTNLHDPGQSKNASLTGATIYTQTDNPLSERPSSCRTNQESKLEDKQKLKEMLKEMKDSLPKKSKHGLNQSNNTKNTNSLGDKNKLHFETPTLRIGTVTNVEINTQSPAENNFTRKESAKMETKEGPSNIALITKQVVIEASSSKPNKLILAQGTSKSKFSICNTSALSQSKNLKELTTSSIVENKDVQKLNTPLKISSLLNPIYIPKENNIISSSSETGLLHTKIISAEISGKKTVANVELTNEQNTVLSNLTAITPSTTQILQVKPLQENSKVNQDLSGKQLYYKVDQNINKSSTQDSEQNLLKSNPIEKSDAVKICASVSDKVLLTADKTRTPQTTAKYSPMKFSPKEKDDGVIQKVDKSISGDFKCNYKTSQNILLSKNTSLPPIAEVDKTSNSDIVYVEKKDINNTKANSDVNLLTTTPSSSSHSDTKADHHFQRRSLINQLEQSIAKGDERAAAEAAAKLAQLRLSCSVLSFSSQIISEPTSSDKAKNLSSIVQDGTSPNQLISNRANLPPKVKLDNICNVVASTSATNIAPEINKSLPTNTAVTIVELPQKSEPKPSVSTHQNDLVA